MKATKLIYGLAVSIGLFISGCSDKLDLKDPQSLDPATALSTDANVKKVLLGGYDALSSSNFYGGNVQFFADLLAADAEISWVGTFNTYREVFGKNILKTNPLIAATWGSGYEVINVANSVIKAIDVVKAADKDRVKGEALFLRGAALFELTRLFGKDYTDGSAATNLGVPIMLQPTAAFSEILTPSRSTVEQCYQQAIADLTEAENLLPNTNSVFATKSAAAGMLARIYLQKADYAGARDAANRAITNATGKSLTATYAEAFNNAENTTEDIFAIQVSDQDGANNLHLFYSIPDFGGRDGDVEINQKHLDLYNPIDDRLNLFYDGAGAIRSGKWMEQYKNVKVIRLAEMYLIRAEANFRLGTAVGATPAADLHQTRGRAGLPFLAAPTLNDILLERRLELAHEGFGIHDVRRLKRSVDGLLFSDNHLVFPIPQREINVNPNLIQNPGYN